MPPKTSIRLPEAEPVRSAGKLTGRNRDVVFKPNNGAPERIRTSDPQIRSLVLYPAELRAPAVAAFRRPHGPEAAD